MSEVMLDLETMSTKPNAVVISIGAAKFDLSTGNITDKFYRVLPVNEQEALGRHVSASTMLWWANQPDDAREVFKVKPDAPVIQVLDEFNSFMKGVDGVWGNGSDFDNVILGSLFESYNIRRPWTHKQNRCFRTMKNLYPLDASIPYFGTEHNALDDALYQIEWLTAIMYKLENSHA